MYDQNLFDAREEPAEGRCIDEQIEAEAQLRRAIAAGTAFGVDPDLAKARLKPVADILRPAVAAELLRQLDHRGLRQQSLAGRLMLARALAGSADKSPYLRVLASLPDHSRAQRQALIAFGHDLRASGEFARVAKGWRELKIEERHLFLTRLCAAYAKHLGFVGPSVHFFTLAPVVTPVPGGEQHRVRQGEYDPQTDRISINDHPKSNFDNFNDTVISLLHEATHAWQADLVRRPPSVVAGNAMRGLSSIFRQALQGGYVESGQDHRGYQLQPLESGARRFPAIVLTAERKPPPERKPIVVTILRPPVPAR